MRLLQGLMLGTLVAVLIPAAPAYPGCSNGSCGGSYAPLPQGVGTVCDCSGACVCGCQTGGGCPCRGVPAATPKAVGDAVPNFGVDRKGDRVPYRLNGREVSKREAHDVVANGVPDDRGKRRVTVIGADADRSAALATIGAPPWAVVTQYRPDDWHVSEAGFVTGGKPTVYVQEPDGRVVHRQDEPSNLALALRRADPSYDPKTDPDLRVGSPIAVAGVHVPSATIGALSVGGLWLLARFAPLALAGLRKALGGVSKDELAQVLAALAEVQKQLAAAKDTHAKPNS